MAHLFKKYEFNSKEQADEKIEALGVKYDDISEQNVPTHNHSIVRIGYIELEPAEVEIDEEGNVTLIEDAVYADKYSVDVLWSDLSESPYGWKSYEISVEGNGVHTFAGINFNG